MNKNLPHATAVWYECSIYQFGSSVGWLEIRSSRTRHRGWVFFAQSKATGQLLGRARLVDCFELSADTFEAHAHRHGVAAWSSLTYKRAFAWVLEQAERFEKPFAYAHRPGAVVWVNVR